MTRTSDVSADLPAALDRRALSGLERDIGPDGVRGLAALFARETTARLRRIASPEIARDVLWREVHTLKGAAGVACAARLARLAARMEGRAKKDGRLTGADLAALSQAFEVWAAEMDIPLNG